MLRSRNIPVTFLVREKFWDGVYPWRQMINRHILEHHIDLRLETNLVEIISDEKDMKQSSPIKARLLIAKLLA
jgi:NADPH-dependent 2,4-dienoyl-CoA reductase/sulfur reductase-like enzyme